MYHTIEVCRYGSSNNNNDNNSRRRNGASKRYVLAFFIGLPATLAWDNGRRTFFPLYIAGTNVCQPATVREPHVWTSELVKDCCYSEITPCAILTDSNGHSVTGTTCNEEAVRRGKTWSYTENGERWLKQTQLRARVLLKQLEAAVGRHIVKWLCHRYCSHVAGSAAMWVLRAELTWRQLILTKHRRLR